MSSPHRAAIVGAGLMGRWHADAASRAGAHVAAIVDIDPSRADRLAASREGCRAYPSLADALEIADVVHICTPADTHELLAREALDARRHVLVEKPLTGDASTAASLLDRAAAGKVLVCPVHQALFQDGVERAREWLDSIAPLQHVAITICSAGADADPASRDRIAREILPHPASLLRRLVPAAWPDAGWAVRHPGPGEIRAIADAGGLTASILISMRGRPTQNRLTLVGAAGTCAVDLFHGFAVLHHGSSTRAGKIAGPFVDAMRTFGAAALNLTARAVRREPAYPGLRALVRHFYRAIDGFEPPPIARAEILDVARICDRLQQALSGGP